jgi:sulfofructose kinase
MEKQWDILGVGSASVDDLLFVDHFPQPDEKMAVHSKLRRCGGQTSTALVAAARHGAKTAFFSCFGVDDLSETLLRALEHEGVDCSPVIRDPRCLPIHSVVIVDIHTGSRTILFHSSGFREPSAEDVTVNLIHKSKMVFIDQNTPHSGYRAARIARQLGIPVAADLEFKSSEQAAPVLPLIDHLIVGVEFASRTTGKTQPEEMVAVLAQPARDGCVVTGGSKGCWYAVSGQPAIHQPAYQVAAVDTTGCGDVFHGVYAASVARGEETPRAVELASGAAAIKATRTNGWAGIPTLAEVQEFLRHR